MSSVALSVRRLRLELPRGEPVHALCARVEDALRISSKPVALAQRFVLLRRLRLVLPRQASAQSLALQLEHEWRRLEALARPMADANADAPAVWAADEAQARLQLLQRWLAQAEVSAWFWLRLLPDAPLSLPLEQRLRTLLFAPFTDEAGPSHDAAPLRRALWRQAISRIVAAGYGEPLRTALRDAEVEALRADGVAVEMNAMPRRGTRLAVSAGFEVDAPSSDPRRNEVVAGVHAGTVPRPIRPASTIGADKTETFAKSAPQPLLHVAPEASARGTAKLQPAPHSHVASAAPFAAPTLADASAAFDEALATEWAGLWFLLPLLLRLGLAQEPQPAALLAAVLRRAAARCDFDVAASAWIEQVVRHATPDRDFSGDSEAEAWWRRARFASLQLARLPLQRVLLRPGRVWLAPHRVDVELALQRADVRIRRAGFDIDPGYVPWLDAVFHFHYR